MKLSLDDLRIFGGPLAFDETQHVGRPNIGNRDRLLARLDDLLDRRWLTNNGPYVQEFEQRIADLVGVKHCIATSNATVALEIAARAAELSGEVIIPSFTFVATAHALQWIGITPVFCDVESEGPNIDPDAVEKAITPATSGILGVHVWGKPCGADRLGEIARRYGLRLLFDAAHAFGCSYRGRMIGSLGDAEVFSFHATKCVNAFEGGAIVTNDDGIAARAKLMRNFGFATYDVVTSLGINGKMTEICAAMGLTSLESMAQFTRINYDNYRQYRRELADLPGITVMAYDEGEQNNYHYVVIEIDELTTGLGRDAFHQILWEENVRARRYFYPGCHQLEPYRSLPRYADLSLPNTERLTARVLCLPSGSAVTPGIISEICQIIRLVATHGREIRERLSSGEFRTSRQLAANLTAVSGPSHA